MNYNRFVFFVIASILSNLLLKDLLVEAKASMNSVAEQTIVPVDSIQIAEVNPSIDRDRSDERDNLKNATAEEPLVMSKRLGLTGIAIVSFISLILLKFLFIPPANKNSPTPTSSVVKTKGSKRIVNDLASLNDTSKSSVNFEVIPTFAGISLSSAISSDVAQYEEKSIVENFETTNQLTRSSFNISKIDVVVELIKYLQQPDENLRREAIWELAQIGDSRGIKPLTEILSQANSADRSLILEAIIQITQRSFQPIEELLFFTFNDASPETKQNAIRDLAAIYAFVAPITKQLAQMQTDGDVQVRQTAKLAIEQLNLCYFPCLFKDCPSGAEHNSISKQNKRF